MGWKEKHTASYLPFGKATFPLKVHRLSNGCPSSCSLSLSSSRPSVSFPVGLPGTGLSPLILSLYCMQGGLTRLTFLCKEPKQDCVQEILQSHQTSPVWEEMPTPYIFLWTWSSHLSRPWAPMSTESHVILWLKIHKWLFCRWLSEGSTVEFHSLIYVRRVPLSTLKAELNEHFLVNKYTFYLLPIGYLFVKLLMRKLLVYGMGWRINHVPYMLISWVTSLLAPKTTIVQPTKLIYNLMLPNLVYFTTDKICPLHMYAYSFFTICFSLFSSFTLIIFLKHFFFFFFWFCICWLLNVFDQPHPQEEKGTKVVNLSKYFEIQCYFPCLIILG